MFETPCKSCKLPFMTVTVAEILSVVNSVLNAIHILEFAAFIV